MKKLIYSLFVLCCLSFGTFTVLSAQTDAKSDFRKFYIDADVGFFFVPDYTIQSFTHLAVGGGYRFHEYHAIGAEYRGVRNDDYYYNESAKGLGVCYRLDFKGVFGKISVGKIITSKKGEFESPSKFDYTGGGIYTTYSLGYHFRSGVLLGISYTGVGGTRFDRSQFEFAEDFEGDFYTFWDIRDATPDAGMFFPAGEFRSNFGAFTIMIGYAFPGRGKKEKKKRKRG